MNRYWRLVATAIGFGVFGLGTLVMSLLLSLLLPVMPLAGPQKRRFTRHCIHRTAVFYVTMLRWLGLLKLELPDLRTLCPQGGLVVANHPMLLDAVFIMSVLPQATFIVKSALARNLFTARLVHYAGYVPNNTDGESLVADAATRIDTGEILVIFPEGTRTEVSTRIKFRRGAANIALRANCAVLPLAIHLQPKLLRKSDPWYHVPVPIPTYRIEALAQLGPSDLKSDQDPPGKQVRRLNRTLEDRIWNALQSWP